MPLAQIKSHDHDRLTVKIDPFYLSMVGFRYEFEVDPHRGPMPTVMNWGPAPQKEILA